MPPAVVAAGIGAAGAIGGAVLSSHAQKSASQQATDATTAANHEAVQAQLELGNKSLDLQRQMYNNNVGLQTGIYNQNFSILSPFVSRGNVAGSQINALLGLPNAPTLKSTVKAPKPIVAPAPTATATNALAPASPSYTTAQLMAMQHDGIPGNYAAAIGQSGGGGGGIPGIISPIGALLTGGKII